MGADIWGHDMRHPVHPRLPQHAPLHHLRAVCDRLHSLVRSALPPIMHESDRIASHESVLSGLIVDAV